MYFIKCIIIIIDIIIIIIIIIIIKCNLLHSRSLHFPDFGI